MHTVARIASQGAPYRQPATTIFTTLYDLIEAIHDEVPAGGENVVASVVTHLFDSGRIRFIGNPDSLKIDIS
jgi:hypothetical protein